MTPNHQVQVQLSMNFTSYKCSKNSRLQSDTATKSRSWTPTAVTDVSWSMTTFSQHLKHMPLTALPTKGHRRD